MPDISFNLPEGQDPFQRLLKALKTSPRTNTLKPLTEMSKDKKPQGSKPKPEPKPEETTIGSMVQVVSDDKEIKAVLPMLFTGEQKDTKKFLLEVQLYIMLNPKAFKNNRLKELFMLSYMQEGPGQFWKNKKMELLLAEEDPTKAPPWKEFLEEFKTSFKLLNVELDAQMKLQDLKIKEHANEYTYQF
ncbi:hypothetical protein Moror_12121 [Moniliophthora roreri MCA 2997]|uniref:Retrotransposon gag domain-containing protein n=2 Tax=Moniliophthora roreri TaxID=221103 RepID=V2WL89_MONRO|nr:hypothetical protein Moror_12121 [Moniliophthora roreri MCA 2997]